MGVGRPGADGSAAARDILLLSAFEEARTAAAAAGIEVIALKGAALLLSLIHI